uniref:Uncharacterized protein n=1 Tax=Strongyloides venezuelensis TaxID=75913 RepID=A0A0K0G5Y5_STRVS
MWSSGQDSWFSPTRPGSDSRHGKNFRLKIRCGLKEAVQILTFIDFMLSNIKFLYPSYFAAKVHAIIILYILQRNLANQIGFFFRSYGVVGYHVCFTRRRSPVRTRLWPVFLKFILEISTIFTSEE